MSDKEKAIVALSLMIKQNEARQEKQQELREWFSKLNEDLLKAIESLKQGA
ncbi:peptidase [Desulforamulus aquiferis]|uniref:Peptidase n=1 Tax=Desulforamulus aquiferis TaxID=1397668 RepID=A0AAW7ZGY8_9FIRM|nr:peptidase [Desulforamulus aquiferis]MDO7788591.1 peptidase [Desulforamulus aquiferis]